MKYLFIAGLFLSMAAVGLTIRCYVCDGCTTATRSQLQTCSSTFLGACSMVETSGHVVRSCGSTDVCIGCTSSECTLDIDIPGSSDRRCSCYTDGCNGQTTTLASTESPSIRCYSCFGCTTTTQSQLQTCSSTFFDACLMVETLGYVVRSCGVSTLGIGCVEVGFFGLSEKTCTCQTDGCNGPTVPGTTTLASTESPTIRCYVCDGCTTVTQSQLRTCSSTVDACSMVETSGYVVRSCVSSYGHTGCISINANGISEKICNCETDGCNGQIVPGTTTLANTESPTIRCYVCDGCTTVTQSQLQTCSSTTDACSMEETSGHVVRRCISSYSHTGCISGNVAEFNGKICNCLTDGCNGPTPQKTTTLASTENGSNGGGAPKANIVGSLIAIAVGKILL